MKTDCLLSFGSNFKSWLSALSYESETNRLFIGTYGQEILIYDLGSNPPSLLHTLTGHNGSIRCLYYAPKERYLFSGGFDAMAGIWSISPAKETHRSRSVAWLSGGPAHKIKSIIFLNSEWQVLTGFENGFIGLWDALTGKLLYVFNAHDDAVTTLHFIENKKVLISGSLDGRIKFWQFTGGPLDSFGVAQTSNIKQQEEKEKKDTEKKDSEKKDSEKKDSESKDTEVVSASAIYAQIANQQPKPESLEREAVIDVNVNFTKMTESPTVSSSLTTQQSKVKADFVEIETS